jgi:NAD(P)H-binding
LDILRRRVCRPLWNVRFRATTAKIGTAGNGRSVPEARGLTIRHVAKVAAAWLRGTNLARRTIITNYELGKIAEVNWVIVRPVILTDGPKTNAYRALVDPRDWTCGFISRADVADFLVKQIDDDAFCIRRQCSRAPFLLRGASPRGPPPRRS